MIEYIKEGRKKVKKGERKEGRKGEREKGLMEYNEIILNQIELFLGLDIFLCVRGFFLWGVFYNFYLLFLLNVKNILKINDVKFCFFKYYFCINYYVKIL